MSAAALVREPQVDDLADLGVSALLAEVTETTELVREAEVHQLRLAHQWATAHPAVDAAQGWGGAVPPGVLNRPETSGGAGTPAVAAFTAEPLAVAMGCSTSSALSLLADALDLHHRLPLLWDQTSALLVPVWKARRVAERTRELSADAARWVDRQLGGRVSSVGAAALDRLVAEAAARCDGEAVRDRAEEARAGWDVVLERPDPRPYSDTSELRATGDTLDLTRFHDVVCAEAEAMAALGDTDDLGVRKAKALGVIADAQARLDLTSLLADDGTDPGSTQAHEAHAAARRAAMARRDAKVRLYLHASLADVVADDPGATGSAESLGPVTLGRIREWAGRSRVTIQPVLHVAADDRWSVDAHDPPPRMAEEVRLRDEHCVFPWCTRPARQSDLDHREPHPPPDSEPGHSQPSDTQPVPDPPGDHAGRCGSPRADVRADARAPSTGAPHGHARRLSPCRCTTRHSPASRRKTVVARSEYDVGRPPTVALMCS